jgi:transposase
VVKVIDIIRRLRQSQPIREIQRELGAHRTVVRELRDLAQREGWLDASRSLPTEREVELARGVVAEGPPSHPLDQFYDEIASLVEQEASCTVIHQVIGKRYSCDESTVRRFVRRRFPQKVKAVIRRDVIAGEVMEVDFGYLGFLEDSDGRQRKAWVFCGRLRYSRRAWREIVFDQRQETFFACHIHAFEYFGGVPRKVVPDNLKAAVITASMQDPTINVAYQQLAQHYGFLISPCLPYHPQHKGGVEGEVKYVKRNFWMQFRHQMRQEGRTIIPISLAQKALEDWSVQIADVRPCRPTKETPITLFEREKVSLLALPPHRWQSVEWRQMTVGLDWHIAINRVWYSVPCHLIGERVDIAITDQAIQIYHHSQSMAIHQRTQDFGKRITNSQHAPPAYHAYKQTDPEYLKAHAESVGPETAAVCHEILDNPVIDGLRPTKAILSLAHKNGSDAIEEACRELKRSGLASPRYHDIAEYLKQKTTKSTLIDAFVFARTIGDFVVSIAIFITTQGISAWILPQP